MTPPPYSPQSNGQGERAVRTIKELLKKNKIASLQIRLSNIVLYYRSAPHSITKMTPSIALNGRNITTVRDRMNPNFVPAVKNSKNIHVYSIGDSVLAFNLRLGRKWYRGTITEVLGMNVYNVFIHDLETTWKRHVQQLLQSTVELCDVPTLQHRMVL